MVIKHDLDVIRNADCIIDMRLHVLELQVLLLLKYHKI